MKRATLDFVIGAIVGFGYYTASEFLGRSRTDPAEWLLWASLAGLMGGVAFCAVNLLIRAIGRLLSKSAR